MASSVWFVRLYSVFILSSKSFIHFQPFVVIYILELRVDVYVCRHFLGGMQQACTLSIQVSVWYNVLFQVCSLLTKSSIQTMGLAIAVQSIHAKTQMVTSLVMSAQKSETTFPTGILLHGKTLPCWQRIHPYVGESSFIFWDLTVFIYVALCSNSAQVCWLVF